MTGKEDLARIRIWQIEALQKENARLNEKLKLQKEKYEQDLIDVAIKTRLEIQKEKFLEEHEK